MTLVFGITILLAVAALFWRRHTKRATRAHLRARPGWSLATALGVTRFDEIDAFLRGARCGCGHEWVVLGEDGRTVDFVALRVVRAECTRCEAPQDFFFRMNEVIH